MKHSLIVATKVLFVCIVFCYPFSLEAARACSGYAGRMQDGRVVPIAITQDSLGKPGGSKIFWWKRRDNKSDFGKAFALSAAVSVGLAIALILFVTPAKGSFFLPLLIIGLLGVGIIYSVIGLFLSKKKRDRIISAISLAFGVVTAFAILFKF